MPSPQLLLLSTAPLRDCGLAQVAADPMSPLGMPSLSLDPVLRGETTAPGLGVREQPAAVWPPGKDPWRGHCQGWGRGLNFSLNFSPLLGAAWGSYPGTGLCEAGSSAAGRENTLNALFHFFPLLFHQALCSAAYLQCRLSSDFPCCFHYHKFIPPGEVSWGCVECKKRKAR